MLDVHQHTGRIVVEEGQQEVVHDIPNGLCDESIPKHHIDVETLQKGTGKKDRPLDAVGFPCQRWPRSNRTRIGLKETTQHIFRDLSEYLLKVNFHHGSTRLSTVEMIKQSIFPGKRSLCWFDEVFRDTHWTTSTWTITCPRYREECEGRTTTPYFRMHSPYLRSKMVRSGVSRKVEQQAPYIRDIMEAGSQAPA